MLENAAHLSRVCNTKKTLNQGFHRLALEF